MLIGPNDVRVHMCFWLLQAKTQLIQARFDHLEARTLAQADLHEGSVDKLQEANRQVLEKNASDFLLKPYMAE